MCSGKKQTQDKERSEYYADDWFIIVPPEGLSNGNGVGLDLVHEIGLLIIAKRSVALEEGVCQAVLCTIDISICWSMGREETRRG